MKPASETRVPIIAFEVQILNNQLKRLFPIDSIYDSPLGRQQDFSGGRKRPISKSIKVIRGTQNKQPPPESSIARRRESFTSIRAQRFALASGVAQFPKPEPCVRRFPDERASCEHKQKRIFRYKDRNQRNPRVERGRNPGRAAVCLSTPHGFQLVASGLSKFWPCEEGPSFASRGRAR